MAAPRHLFAQLIGRAGRVVSSRVVHVSGGAYGGVKNRRHESGATMSPHALSWFEISVTDFARACAFYEEVLRVKLEIHDMGDVLMALLPVGEGGIGGALQYEANALPSEHGTVVYLDAGPDLQPTLDRVEPAGGRVTVPKTQIPGDFGYFAFFTDSEGNRVGLMSPS